MKVALVSPYDHSVPGGVGKHIDALRSHMQRKGHEVRIIAPGVDDGVQEDRQGVYRIGRVTPVPGNGSVARITLSVPFGTRLAHRVRQVLDAEKFDVLHVHEPLMPTLPLAVLMARATGAIKVGTFHAFRESYYGYYYGRPILRRVVNKLDGRIAVSQSAYEFVSRYFAGVYSIIPNGVDLDLFNDRVAPIDRYVDGRPTVLFVGRIEKRKGLAYLIRAYSDLRNAIPNVRIVVVGRQGRAARGYKEYVREHNLSGIEFVGEVSQRELPCYYKSCDVFCAPALSGESFGMVLLEAMAVGKPVVATRIDGYCQVVQDGVQGRLVAPRDSVGLAGALGELLLSPHERRRCGERGRVTAESFSWDRVSARVIRFYHDVRQGNVANDAEWASPLDAPSTWFAAPCESVPEPVNLSQGVVH